MPHRHCIQDRLAALESTEPVITALAPLGWNKARLKCLAAFLVTLLTRQSTCLAKLAPLFPTQATPASAYKRLQRFLKDFAPDLDRLAQTLARLCGVAPPWHLSMDRTNWKLGKAHLNVLLLAIVVPGISFPLLWMTLSRDGAGKAGNSHTRERIALMERFLSLFGPAACACLLADREFAGRDFLAWLEKAGIPYCLRLKADTLVANGRGELCCAAWLFRNCPIQVERPLGFRRVLGRVRYVTGTRLTSGEFLIVVSDGQRALSLYASRWGIETLFGAFKSRGFDLEATHVTDPLRLSRLVALLALAYTWAGVCGLWRFAHAVQAGLKLKKHGRWPISILRLGLDWLQPIAARLCRNGDEGQFSMALRFLSCT
jgi:hypothetical protein